MERVQFEREGERTEEILDNALVELKELDEHIAKLKEKRGSLLDDVARCRDVLTQKIERASAVLSNGQKPAESKVERWGGAT